MMRLGVIFALVAVMAGAEAAAVANKTTQAPTTTPAPPTPPKFCRGLNCPRFTVVRTEKEYQVRKYEASYWASTDMYEMSIDVATRTGFMRLFKYISGHNENKEKVAMTCPVLTKVTPGQGPACESNFTESFMVPFSHQPKAPAPTDKDVYLSSMPEMTVYVKTFGGYAKEAEWIQAAADLSEAIGDSSLFDNSHYFTGGYDSPYQPFNRHNEVWFVAK